MYLQQRSEIRISFADVDLLIRVSEFHIKITFEDREQRGPAQDCAGHCRIFTCRKVACLQRKRLFSDKPQAFNFVWSD